MIRWPRSSPLAVLVHPSASPVACPPAPPSKPPEPSMLFPRVSRWDAAKIHQSPRKSRLLRSPSSSLRVPRLLHPKMWQIEAPSGWAHFLSSVCCQRAESGLQRESGLTQQERESERDEGQRLNQRDRQQKVRAASKPKAALKAQAVPKAGALPKPWLLRNRLPPRKHRPLREKWCAQR